LQAPAEGATLHFWPEGHVLVEQHTLSTHVRPELQSGVPVHGEPAPFVGMQ
jgi:hypothetical protein